MTTRPEMASQRLDEWLEALASQQATPGGGSFAAVAGASGAGLISMVCRLTIGKERFAEVEARMREIAEECDRERVDLLGLAERDAHAFDAVMAAYRMPKGTEAEKQERMLALQAGLEDAAEVPLTVARRAVYLMGLAEEVTISGNASAASDGFSGAAALYAAMLAALANVRINAFAFVDPSRKAELLEDCRRLRDRANTLLMDAETAFTARAS